MEISYFLAQLFGMTLIVFVVAALAQPLVITKAIDDLKPFSFTMMIAGFLGIVGGLAVVLSHNIWVKDWRVIVTLFGWVALIKGVSYVAFPSHLLKTADGILKSKKRRLGALSFALLLGIYLAYHGFNL